MPVRLGRLAHLVCAAVVVGALAWPAAARAQCGAASTECRTCHEIRGERPVSARGPWHRDHAFGDFCATCHGGDAKSKDAARAHVGMIPPLAAPDVACACCHADGAARAARYEAERAREADASTSAPEVARAADAPAPATSTAATAALASIAAALALGGAAMVAANERRRRRA